MLHFIYRVPPSTTLAGKVIDRLQWELMRRSHRLMPTSWRGGVNPAQKYRQRAPYSITIHMHQALAQHFQVKLYDLHEPGGLRFSNQDILLGHPWPNGDTITNRALLDPKRCRLKALIFPLHHGIPEINTYAIPYMERADVIFGIMGETWYNTLDTSIYSRFKPKIIPLDMAVDTQYFPHLKTGFNPPGRRGYLYIGRNAVEKGSQVLAETMRGLGEYPRGWIGSGDEIPGMQREAAYVDLTPEYVRRLAQKYDFFVNTSISDANPTTLLEAMAWGFPVACTPESGYANPKNFMALSTTDIAQNIAALQALQFAPDENLRQVSIANRELVETKYTWERFTQTVLDAIQRLTSGASS